MGIWPPKDDYFFFALFNRIGAVRGLAPSPNGDQDRISVVFSSICEAGRACVPRQATKIGNETNGEMVLGR